MQTIALLKTSKGIVISVYAGKKDAEAVAARYSADPTLEPMRLDADAPYSVEMWFVTPEAL